MRRNAERFILPALAFAVPAGVMLWVYACLGMAPWGDKTVLISDMSSQYVEFFCALKNGDLFFSWSKALGTGYIGVFSYYVSSPLSLLTLLVPNRDMPIGLMFLTVLKIGLSGWSFALFARRRFPDCGYAALVGAVCYALMSYTAVYSICIMWLDALIWLPLILLALERILAGRGAGPFLAALTMCFLSTWYLSYMVGAFCALYLCARLIALKPDGTARKKILLRFFGGAACALCLTAWMWLPTFLAMYTGKFSGGNLDYDGLLACEPLKLLGQLRIGQYGGIGYGAPPYVYCGVLAGMGAIAYFFRKGLPPRERLANGVVLVVLAASVLLSPLDKAWHLFQRPNWFPFRWSFLFSFFLVYLAVQAAPRLEGKNPWLRRGMALVLAAVSAVDLGYNTLCVFGGLERQMGCDSYRAYREDYVTNEVLVKAAKSDAGEDFFRMGATADRGHSSPLAFGYPGITHYSSLYNYDVNRLTRELGFAQSWMWCAYYGSTPVTDALLDVQYVISADGAPDYEAIAWAGELTLWKNPDVLPVAFSSENRVQGLTGGSPFERQNSLLSGLLGEQAEPFTPVDAAVFPGDGETTLRFVGSGRPVYAYLSASGLTEVMVNGEHAVSLGSSEAACIHCLGTPGAGEKWTVTIRGSGAWGGQLWALDGDALHDAVSRLNAAKAISVEKDGGVRLTIQVDTAQTLYTTIPAEGGWTAYVDGEKAPLGDWLDTFLCLDVPDGAHQVELCYTAPGLVPGIVLGVLALVGLVLVNAGGRWKKNRRGNNR